MSTLVRDTNGVLHQVAGKSVVDNVLSNTSKNPISNKAVTLALQNKVEIATRNLVNYYLKAETYTKEEVNALIGAISTMTIKVVATLPTTDISPTTIYWVGPDSGTGLYDQYIYSDDEWIKTGDTSLDLSGYVLKTTFEAAIADFFTKDEIAALFNDYYTKSDLDLILDEKQDALTFDNVPTSGSENPVKSGGVYSALDTKQDVLEYDTAPTKNSEKMVKSGGIYTALESKQDYLTFDDVPTPSSNNPVKSSGVYNDEQTIYKVMGETGTKNLIAPPFVFQSYQNRGITFITNDDGSISFSGTANNSVCSYSPIRERLYLPAGEYILSDGGDTYGGAAIYLFDDYAEGVKYSGETTGLVVASDYVYVWTNQMGNADWNVNTNHYGVAKKFSISTPAYVRVQARSVKNTYASAVSGTIYPMLRRACDTDETWQPYAKTNRELTEEMKGVNYIETATDTSFVLNETHEGSAFIRKAYGMSVQDGTPTPSTPVDIVSAKVNYNNLGKNLNSFPYPQGKKRVIEGLTFVVGEDGVITMSGEKTTNNLVQYYPMIDTMGWMGYEINWLKPGCTYRLSGCPANGSSSTYRLRIILNYQHGNSSQYVDNGEGVTFTVSSDSIKWARIMIDVSGNIGADYGTQVFHPMLTLASADQTYERGFAKNLYTDLDLRAVEVTSTDAYTYERGGKYYVADTLDWDADKGYYITRRIKSRHLLSTDAWYATDYAGIFIVEPYTLMTDASQAIPYALCTGLACAGVFVVSAQVAYNLLTSDNTFAMKTSAGGKYAGFIYLRCDSFTSVDDLKDWLDANEIYVDYIRATPVVEYLSPEQNALLLSLKTYDGVSFIAPKGTVTPLTTLEYGDGGTIATYALSGHNSVIHQESWDQKNLLRYPYTHTSTTHNGVVYTNNGDGTITANGTASPAQSVFNCRNRLEDNLVLPAGTYIISDGVNRFNECYIDIYGTDENGDGVWLAGTNRNYGIFTLPKERAVGVFIRVISGMTVSNVTFKPMIRKAGTSEIWVPYVKNNKEITQNISNPNLLDNGWFTINQRGRTSYSNSMNGFSVDRWYKNLNINLDIIDDGVRLTKKAASNPTLYQKIEASPYLMGKTVTLSVMTSDGKIRSCVGTFPTTFPSSGNTIICNYNDGTISFRLQAVSTFNPYFIATLDTENCEIDGYLDIRAAKLELGTVSTLAMDAAPNYQQELAKCQRYFVRFTGTSSVGIGFAQTSTKAWITTTLPVAMRVQPTLTLTGTARIQHASGVGDAGPEVTALSINTVDSIHVKLDCTSTGLIVAEGCELNIRNNVSHLDFSADL